MIVKTVTKTLYLCETCNLPHDTPGKAKVCEESHKCKHKLVRYEVEERGHFGSWIVKKCRSCPHKTLGEMKIDPTAFIHFGEYTC